MPLVGGLGRGFSRRLSARLWERGGLEPFSGSTLFYLDSRELEASGLPMCRPQMARLAGRPRPKGKPKLFAA